MDEIKVGDVVTLKGRLVPAMSVNYIDNHRNGIIEAECKWFADEYDVHTSRFDIRCLIKQGD